MYVPSSFRFVTWYQLLENGRMPIITTSISQIHGSSEMGQIQQTRKGILSCRAGLGAVLLTSL